MIARNLIFSDAINSPPNPGTYIIDLSSYIPASAQFVRITAVTRDGDSDCWNVSPYESNIGGYEKDGSFQNKYFYNVAKGAGGGSGFFTGSGYDMELPSFGRKLYVSIPLTCPNTSGAGMNVNVYLNGYL